MEKTIEKYTNKITQPEDYKAPKISKANEVKTDTETESTSVNPYNGLIRGGKLNA